MKSLPGLDAAERLRAHAAASFRGATATSSRGMLTVRATHARMRAYDVWAEIARAAGFPTAGPDMVIGVTDTRLVVWRTSFLSGRPVEIAGDIPLARIAQVAAVRHGIVTGLSFVLDGFVVEVEALRGRPLRRLAAEVRAALADRHGNA